MTWSENQSAPFLYPKAQVMRVAYQTFPADCNKVRMVRCSCQISIITKINICLKDQNALLVSGWSRHHSHSLVAWLLLK